MSDRESVVNIAAHLGMQSLSADWRGVDAVLPLLERMRTEGSVVVLKLDGQRIDSDDNRPYTVVISGGKLSSDGYVHTECATLEEALIHGIVEYAQKCWRYPLRS